MFNRCLKVALGVLIISNFANSESVQIIPADGSKHQIYFSKNDPEVIILSSANTNESSRVVLEILSSTELTVQSFTRKVKKSVKTESLKSVNSGWNQKGIEFYADGSGVSTFRIGGPISSGDGIYRDPNCLCLTSEEIDNFTNDPATIATITALGYPGTREGVCQFNFDAVGKQDCSIFGGTTQTVSAQAIGIEMRDACDKKSKSVTKFKIKPNVDMQKVTGNLVATVSFKSEPYQGSKLATHKPVSDGLWSPEPIFVIESLAQGYGLTKEFVRATKWNNNGISKFVDLKDGLSDYLAGGHLFHRVRSSRALKLGGKAVVEIRSNAGLTYGYCMKMQKKRMNFGGY